MTNESPLDAQIESFYERTDEAHRLATGWFRLEGERTRDILARFLPAAPATVLDVGGGTGPYAWWLAERGYEVHLIDGLPKHIEQAEAAAAQHPGATLASATVGDARRLDHGDRIADAVLLLGPLYHLTERTARIAALTEARRVLRPGGVLLAAAVSRFASTMEGIFRHFFDDDRFVEIAARDRADGQHRNPTGEFSYFTTAYFHAPEELDTELADAGLQHRATLAVEGPAWVLQDFDATWADAARRERLLATIRDIESEPTLLGASSHLIAIGERAR